MTHDEQERDRVEDPKDVPTFKTEADEADFWANHELGDELLERMSPERQDVLPAPRRRAKPISLRMDPVLLDALKNEATARSMPYQSLLKQYLVERLADEDRVTPPQVPSGISMQRSLTPRSREQREVSGGPFERSERIYSVFPCVADEERVRRHTEAVRNRGHVLAFAA